MTAVHLCTNKMTQGFLPLCFVECFLLAHSRRVISLKCLFRVGFDGLSRMDVKIVMKS